MPDPTATQEREAAEHRCPCGDTTHPTATAAAFCCTDDTED